MTKIEFLAELRQRLKRLPSEEIENAILYYVEYFNEAGPEHEQEVIRKIGNPAAIAAKIIGEYAVHDAENGFEREREKSNPRKHGVPVWLLVLAILASPIALPISIAMFCVLGALCFALFMVFFALGISGIVLFAGGIITVGTSVALLFTNFASGLFFSGYALLALAAGTALVFGVIKLARLAALGIQKLLGKFLIKGGMKK